VFENRMLRNVVVPKRDEVRGEYIRLHNEELNGLYHSPNIVPGDQIEKDEIGWVCSTFGESRRGDRVLM
jgi:hypothetical protein